MSNTLKKFKEKNPNYKKPLYICDPNKNVRCDGRFKEGWCGIECMCTVHWEYSKGNKRVWEGDFVKRDGAD